jgi:hypothetical protein
VRSPRVSHLSSLTFCLSQWPWCFLCADAFCWSCNSITAKLVKSREQCHSHYT